MLRQAPVNLEFYCAGSAGREEGGDCVVKYSNGGALCSMMGGMVVKVVNINTVSTINANFILQ